jgi:hypothetical protein
METTFSNDFKKRFLLTFTKELIIHSEKREITDLQKIISSEENKTKEIPRFKKEVIIKKEIPITKKELIKKEIPVKKLIPKPIPEEVPVPEEKISIFPLKMRTHPIPEPVPEEPVEEEQEQPVQKQIPKPKMGKLKVPETQLPPHLAYLKPSLTENKTLTDWEKLNPLIRDNAVRTIEVNPDQKVRVSGSMGERTTSIILNSEEVNEIINKFAYVSRIPVSEGVYKVVVENLIFFAVISNVVGSRFVIQKIQQQENVYPNPYPKRY